MHFITLQHFFIGEIFGIPENVPRFLKNVFHIPDERQLGLASLLSFFTFVLDAQKNPLIETVLLSTHNICFG